ncbi:MAG: cell division protein ZipA [Gammaproteobacteria bacterium]|jgi:cell division protein ZipA|nr:cell division protein ZipA [Gammaproteobacteria bacterium]
MDSNVLRLILIGLGVLLLLGIYLWDRLKRRPKGPRKLRRKVTRERRDPGLAGPPPDIDEADEWRGGAPIEPLPEPEPAAAPPEKRGLFGRRRKKQPETRADALEPPAAGGGPDEMQAPLPFDEPERPKARETPAAAPEAEPSKIVVINVVARGAYFQGAELARVAEEVGMQPGEWNIYHRPDDHDPALPIFSMANIVEPGSFPVGHMEGFSTPGVCLFTQLPGPRDGLAVYSEMLFSGERIAALLDGELQDERHQLLTREKIERTRDEILQQKRQLQLARKLR